MHDLITSQQHYDPAANTIGIMRNDPGNDSILVLVLDVPRVSVIRLCKRYTYVVKIPNIFLRTWGSSAKPNGFGMETYFYNIIIEHCL